MTDHPFILTGGTEPPPRRETICASPTLARTASSGNQSPSARGAANLPRVIYQHPLAHLLGIEGLALLRAFAGEYDRGFVHARLAEIRALLDNAALAEAGTLVQRVDTVRGYRQWSASYDDEANGLFDIDEPVVRDILGALPTGTVLDAACGTGRHAEHLRGRGHRVIGVDSSPEMLARARRRVPSADFRLGDLHRLPLADDEVDAVVCTLALTHVPELGPVFAQFARVLRPGGHLVIADVHHDLVLRGSVPKAYGPDGEPGLVDTYRHTHGEYLRAALPLGLQVRRCEEPGSTAANEPGSESAADRGEAGSEPARPPSDRVEPGPWGAWPWSLFDLIPEAARAAGGHPSLVIWHFQLTER